MHVAYKSEKPMDKSKGKKHFEDVKSILLLA